ncbi:MAG: DUF4412 domain-containing protein [Saprospiraceae bacterium]|nr:DUF4412 domain-containing protein [Saprospiraceae bacterium]
MKKYILILLCNLLLVCAFGQNKGKEYEEKGKQKVENRIDNKVDEAMDKALNKIEGLFSKKPKKNKEEEPSEESSGTDRSEENGEDEYITSEEIEQQRIEREEAEREKLQEMLGSTINEGQSNGEVDNKVAYQSTFVGSFTMIFDSFKNGKQEKHSPATIHFHYNRNLVAMIMEGKDTKMAKIIMDSEENSMTMITEDNGKKTGMKMKRPNIEKITTQVMDDLEVTKTGIFKTIDTYRCEKILSTNKKDGYKTTSWVTRDFPIDYREVFQSMAMGRIKNSGANQEWIDGFSIESESVSGNGKEVVITKTKNIKIGTVDKSVFDTSGVEIMSLPGF